MRRYMLLSFLPLLLSGCAGALVSAGAQTGMAIAENRSLGRKVDDTVIYTDLANQFLQANQARLLSKVTFNVRFSRVMLTGRVVNIEDAEQAVALAWKAKGVTEVINELVVDSEGGFLTTAEDALVKRNLEARLLITKGVWVINYSIDVQSGTAYLIGRVKDQAELDRALNVVRTTKGVKRVVSHLQINPDMTQPVTSPDGFTPATNASGSGTPVSEGPRDTNASPDGWSHNSNADVGASQDIYTGPVYSGGSISSKPN
jgi:osmotically-inducible protein OsmY